MRISHVLAIFILAVAAFTWFFDRELKRKHAGCAAYCEQYEAPRTNREVDNGSRPVARDKRAFDCGCEA